jgi:UDP-3-O-[3-hydroxymyristoyl] N-acetylglucosamine deacetylase
MLDAVGDLALAGAPILGAYQSVRGGHRLNANVLRALFDDPEAWTMVSAPQVRDGLPLDLGLSAAAVSYAAERP